MKIAILGSTSQIAKSLAEIYGLNNELRLFCRAMNNFRAFGKESYDLIINCVGVATPINIKKFGMEVVQIANLYDDMVLQYLKKNPTVPYVYFSSGVVKYPELDSFYRTSKLNIEARHRELPYAITDLRLYSFFSRYIKLNSGFMLTEIINCLREKRVFHATAENMYRDYIHPQDLAKMILELGHQNRVIEPASREPVSFKEILRYFQGKGLRVSYAEYEESPTGQKIDYIPTKNKEFYSEYSSIDTVIDEAEYFL